jgi:hypothetical protein
VPTRNCVENRNKCLISQQKGQNRKIVVCVNLPTTWPYEGLVFEILAAPGGVGATVARDFPEFAAVSPEVPDSEL